MPQATPPIPPSTPMNKITKLTAIRRIFRAITAKAKTLTKKSTEQKDAQTANDIRKKMGL